MLDFELLTPENAPERCQHALSKFEERHGFVPNMQRAMAISPEMLNLYLASMEEFNKTSLSPIEQEVVLIATSVENNCGYCIAAHSGRAENADLPPEDLAALRTGANLSDPKLNTLRDFTRKIVTNRGLVSNDDVETLLAAGYNKKNLMEILLGVANKTISNYVNHIVNTPLDLKFQPNEWEKPSFWSIARRPDVRYRALRVAMIVGPLIGFINHGDSLIAGSMTTVDWLKVVLTFLVPFCVSTWSSTMAIRNKPADV